MPDLGDVAQSLVRVIEAVTPEVIDQDQAKLETLIRHVGLHNFRRRIPQDRSVEFNFELEGVSATVTEDGSKGIASTDGTKAPLAKPDRTIYWPRAEEVLREAFTKTEGGVQFVFVGAGFWKFLLQRKLMTEGRLGAAQVIMLKHQPDRDVFLIGKLDDLVLDIEDIPEDRMARVTVISNDASFMERPKKPGGQRLLSVQEQREFMATLDPEERNQELATALEHVRDHTAKSTLRTLFPELPEDEMLAMLRTIRNIRPCAVRVEATNLEETIPTRQVSEEEMVAWRGRQDGRVVGRVGAPVRRTTVTADTKVPNEDDET